MPSDVKNVILFSSSSFLTRKYVAGGMCFIGISHGQHDDEHEKQ
jgi:hypothetical protein